MPRLVGTIHMNAFALAPLILVFPVIGVLFNGLVGRRFVVANRESGEKWSGWFATSMVLRLCRRVVAAGSAWRAMIITPRSLTFYVDQYPLGGLHRALGFAGGYAVGDDDAGGDRRRLADPYLRHRLHARRPQFLPFLRLLQPIHLLHADPGHRQQLLDAVCRLGRGRPLLLSADWLLV